MDNKTWSVSATSSALIGAGLTQLTTNLNVALILVGIGVVLQLIVAFLQKAGVPVAAVPPQPLG